MPGPYRRDRKPPSKLEFRICELLLWGQMLCVLFILGCWLYLACTL